MSFNDYVGLPFKERGRDDNGYDCWGLLAAVYRKEFGIILPSFANDYVTTEDSDHLAKLIDGKIDDEWQQLEPGQETIGDGVLISLRGYPRHVGILAPNGYILHIERETGSLMERASSPMLSKRIIGYFRHKDFQKVIDESASEAKEGT